VLDPFAWDGTHCGDFAMADWLEEGRKAPEFKLPADEGGDVKLSDLRGRPVVVYFYPRDNTPGCTREACAFRDQSSALKKLGAVVLGISTDSTKSHAKFRRDHKLNFPLLADEGHKVAEKFGAWREKNMYGKKTLGIQRSTFLIDADGVVRRVWRSVKVDGHDEQVLEALAELSSATNVKSSKSRTVTKRKSAT
jgi:peroxiredoxin Q/BCP